MTGVTIRSIRGAATNFQQPRTGLLLSRRDANYQRFEAAGSYHFPLYDGAWMNLGLSHGVVVTIGSREQDLPFNRRFFPGGEHSIRGYQEGEASPRDATGQFVGAETYVLGNVEFEQSLTRSFSVVIFSDSIGFARDLNNYPLNEALFSAGAGLRWKTIVGPSAWNTT